MNEDEIRQQKIILFDGICNLCTGSVLFILKREKGPLFRFGSIQSAAGQGLLQWCGLPRTYDQAVIYVENGRSHVGATAALKIGKELVFPWPVLSYLGFLVPGSVRDWVYNLIARNRYQWFGKREICMVPTEALAERFL